MPREESESPLLVYEDPRHTPYTPSKYARKDEEERSSGGGKSPPKKAPKAPTRMSLRDKFEAAPTTKKRKTAQDPADGEEKTNYAGYIDKPSVSELLQAIKPLFDQVKKEMADQLADQLGRFQEQLDMAVNSFSDEIVKLKADHALAEKNVDTYAQKVSGMFQRADMMSANVQEQRTQQAEDNRMASKARDRIIYDIAQVAINMKTMSETIAKIDAREEQAAQKQAERYTPQGGQGSLEPVLKCPLCKRHHAPENCTIIRNGLDRREEAEKIKMCIQCLEVGVTNDDWVHEGCPKEKEQCTRCTKYMKPGEIAQTHHNATFCLMLTSKQYKLERKGSPSDRDYSPKGRRGPIRSRHNRYGGRGRRRDSYH
ncbi:CCHC-type domain-containing protein [Caenorhabditis elegans]|uniref:CCHC-type domain-containing protein n=1 Tax=Caenorhabditis elegans TaxID=6239 RepID=A0A4V6M3D5_CAEEL|nr:CCHC-type domain-containing protein [Caenorhabditis elegans]VTW47571.1 CCHC-type domain-containing protein [Caenorhabditis elegans]